MKAIRKTVSMLLVFMLAIGLFSDIAAQAKEIKLPVPKIKVKAVDDGIGVEITIGKTKDADGYEVYISTNSDKYRDIYGDYKDVDDGFRKEYTLDMSGSKKRTYYIFSLFPGKYNIKVRSYNNKKYGTLTYSDYSKGKSVKIKEAANGYKKKYDFSKVKKGDVIKFGAYEQDNDFLNGNEPIEWIVLEKTKKAMLVVSKYALDCLPYNKSHEQITWEKCTLRKWLNDEFYRIAFNKSEQGLIKTTTIETFDNALYGTSGGEDTKDKIFLLSAIDMINTDYGFDESDSKEDVNRRCAATAYAIAQGVHSGGDDKTKDGETACAWWLRSPGGKNVFGKHFAANVYRWGSVGSLRIGSPGEIVDEDSLGVRPALYIKLNP